MQTSNSSITLWANVENLIMTGSANLNAAGNALGNAITGNSGNNAIWGHGGIDTITGGSGTDTFLFTANSDSGNGLGSRDIITDFNQGQSDIIDLSAFAGTFSFIGTGAFTGASQARYSQTGSDTIIDVDSNGDGSYDFQIELTGLITLVATDFVL